MHLCGKNLTNLTLSDPCKSLTDLRAGEVQRVDIYKEVYKSEKVLTYYFKIYLRHIQQQCKLISIYLKLPRRHLSYC